MSENVAACLGVLSLILLGFVLGATFMCFVGGDYAMRLKKEAIESGVANYVINPKTGESRFQFVKLNTGKPTEWDK